MSQRLRVLLEWYTTIRKPVAFLIYAAKDFLDYRTLLANDLVLPSPKVNTDFDFTKKR